MDLKLDDLIGKLNEGVDNVIRSHFAGIITTPDPTGQSPDAATLLDAAQQLDDIAERLTNLLTPTTLAHDATATVAPAPDETHPEVVGQPAPA